MSGNLAGEGNGGSDARPPRKKFFISYSSKDKTKKDAFCRALDSKDVPYWTDKELRAGAMWGKVIPKKIDESAGLILLMSGNSSKSPNVHEEVRWARRRGKKLKTLFPVRLDTKGKSDDLEMACNIFQITDLSRGFDAKKLKELTDALLDHLQSEIVELPPEPPAERHGLVRWVKAKLSAWTDLFERMRSFAGTRSFGFKALAFTLAVASVWGLNKGIAQNDRNFVVAQQVFNWATFFPYLVAAAPSESAVSADPRDGRSKLDVRLIEIGGVPDIDVGCEERRYIGDLLKTLAFAHASVVVIDSDFPPNPKCGNETANLLEGAARLCEEKAVTVVVGREVNKDNDPPWPLKPSLNFAKAEPRASCVIEGVMNFDPDLRRVAFRFRGVNPFANSRPTDSPPPSLALAAALAYPGTKDREKLARDSEKLNPWSFSANPPYTSLLKPDQFAGSKRNAREVLCYTNDTWRACAKGERDLDNFRGKVVVIGDGYGEDRHSTVVGEVWGYMIHASYMQSLIEDRLSPGVPEWFNWLAGLGVFIGFEYLTRHFHGLKALGAVALLVAGVAATVAFVAWKPGYYFNPTLVSILAVLYQRILPRGE